MQCAAGDLLRHRSDSRSSFLRVFRAFWNTLGDVLIEMTVQATAQYSFDREHGTTLALESGLARESRRTAMVMRMQLSQVLSDPPANCGT